MSMVTTALYNPVTPVEVPIAFRMFLLCRMSRPTIIRVRRILREIEIEKYGTPKLEAKPSERLLG